MDVPVLHFSVYCLIFRILSLPSGPSGVRRDIDSILELHIVFFLFGENQTKDKQVRLRGGGGKMK